MRAYAVSHPDDGREGYILKIVSSSSSMVFVSTCSSLTTGSKCTSGDGATSPSYTTAVIVRSHIHPYIRSAILLLGLFVCRLLAEHVQRHSPR